ncbi:hypothetical protein A3B02_00435 [Candidatus Roizmanbacteria bacterium RIFCSPLOWO2_01_FULL_42_14]|uniref:GMP synthase n=3 Tax=Candidatus Roizmaniibacteriota TaxID=1752723 RepID=A0A1F7JAT5_9BACT|nr:MAG: hypothetical protein A3D08_02635 [Candidatus Roizmanbacteria bacterium RIFCSPHIGHO2_02_FULL_43_11]OGK37738.1 MAG: hypothetical protein A3F32_00800 [Candidatus Roizmanbacteria bacterium RIFCSPHIGHO2_12_FULL_42_10]OGK52722.1 MAG: hypothetical protein A3B02_00435 [Candidatus Roizmanbacteria bacterium RIFCSPLOWO2_01_FULL_42_14]
MHRITSLELKKHSRQEHYRSPFAQYLREIVYGGSDGIVTTFAVVAGFSGAQVATSWPTLSFLSVLLFGFANLLGDATSMGLGNYLSVTADQDAYKKERQRELLEIRNKPDFEYAETVSLLKKKGFSHEDAERVAHLYKKNEQYWVDFMMHNELNMPDPHQDKPAITSLATFISFILFGSIPLFPYMFINGDGVTRFMYSMLLAFSALLVLGVFRWKVTQQHLVRSVGETLLIGSLSSLVAYFVGGLFKIG